MKDQEILDVCKNANVTLKSSYRNSSVPVNVMCNECGTKFPVPITQGSVPECPICSDRKKAIVIENQIVKIDLEEKVEKTKKDKKKSKKLY